MPYHRRGCGRIPIKDLPEEKLRRLRERYIKGSEPVGTLSDVFGIKGSSNAIFEYADEHDWVRRCYGASRLRKYKDEAYRRSTELPDGTPAYDVLQRVTKRMWKRTTVPQDSQWWGSKVGETISAEKARKMIEKGGYEKISEKG